MPEIKLTKGQVAIVDYEDFEGISKFKWHTLKARGRFYAARRDCRGGKALLLMHRVVLDAPVGMEVDHINGNPLNNRRVNLRLATKQQNQHNRKHPQKDNRLGVKGVYWRKNIGKYQATIGYNCKTIYLGLFTSLSDADKAYRDAEVKYFGEFARRSD